MAKSVFRLFLFLYVVLVIAELVTGFRLRSGIPEDVSRAESAALYYDGPARSAVVGAVIVTGCIIVILSLAGIIGLFCLRSFARYPFLIAGVMACILHTVLIEWTVITRWESLCGSLSTVIAGVILTVCFTPLGRKLFSVEEESNKTSELSS